MRNPRSNHRAAPRSPPYQRLRRLLVVGAITLVGAAFYQGIRLADQREPADLKARFIDVAPFVELVEVGPAGWVGRVDSSWRGLTNPAVADAACDALQLRLKPIGRQNVILLAPKVCP